MRWEEEGMKQNAFIMGNKLMGSNPHAFSLIMPSIPITHTQTPYVTGTSVLGIKYKDGVLIAADTAGSYGSTTRYKSVERLRPIGQNTLVGATGEMSDFQTILQILDRLIITNAMFDDDNTLGPPDIHSYLNRVMYNQRNKLDPFWNTLMLGGVKNGVKYLGNVTMLGLHYVDDHVATGFGIHLAQPIFRNEWNEDMTLEQGTKLLEKCMLVLFYRDRSAINKMQIANITEDGVKISEPYALQTKWDYEAFSNPTVGNEGSW
ncbi:unnamed protein product [Sphagnum jensenii]|uniref:Proteasome subunit beta n=1 Tax=Sphagnum jensenii TaxID=128206 RepID=A0ABP0WCE9_9BRYO